MRRPAVVAFDIIETVISLEPLRRHFTDRGFPSHALEHWFSIGLREAFALGATGKYQPFKQVLGGAFDELFAVHGLTPDQQLVQAVLGAMPSLPAHAGAMEAFQMLRGEGVRVFALSNGSRSATTALLEANGLISLVENVLSTDDAGLPKPRPEVYRHLLRTAEVEAGSAALVATHGWDLQGAASVGMVTAFVEHRKPYPTFLPPPDLAGRSLADVAASLLQLSAGDAQR